ncbi:unnamed protein product [Jaminaea pallidilutea]
MPSRLKSTLADLDDVAPIDEDRADAKSKPRKSFGDASSDEEVDEDGDEAGSVNRDHYAAVGPSSRKKQANLSEDVGGVLNSGRYQGTTAKWEDLADDDSEDSEGDDDEDGDDDVHSESDMEDGGSDDDEEITSEGSADEEEGVSNHGGPSSSRGRKSVRFESEVDTDDQDSNVASSSKSRKPSTSKPQGPTLTGALSEQEALVKSLRSQAEEDAVRGRAVRDQLSFWQRVLENRIKMERVVGPRGIAKVDPHSYRQLLDESDEHGQKTHNEVLDSLLEQSQRFLATQVDLLEEEAGVAEDLQAKVSEAHEAGQKRKRDAQGDDAPDEDESRALHHQQLALTLRFESEVLQPYATTVLERHSSRASASEADSNRFSSSGGSSGLKALNQSINRQIASAMAGEGGERLVDRTRRYRGQGSRIGKQSAEMASGDSTTSTDASKALNVEDVETFDDSDFYSWLLRSFIDSANQAGMGQGDGNAVDGGGSAQLFHPRTNTKTKGIDTRASKGRKLRYDIIEKVANFMPRIGDVQRSGENGAFDDEEVALAVGGGGGFQWDEGRRRRLFESLPGRIPSRRAEGDEDSEDEDVGAASKRSGGLAAAPNGLGGLRIF